MLFSPVVIPVHQFMPEALAGLLRNAPLTPEKIAFAWRTAVGPAVDRATAIALHDGTLRVRAHDAAWADEIRRSAPLIRARLDALLGAGVVRDVDVTSEPLSSQSEDKRGIARRRP